MVLQAAPDTRTKLLTAAVYTIRAKGYAATTVDDLCATAAVSKGSFFHHFKSKDGLALAAVEQFATMARGMFTAAPYRQAADPLDRLLGYVDFRVSILSGELPEYTCLLGTLVQETYDTHPDIRDACDRAMAVHIVELTRDVALARELYSPEATWTAESVGYFMQSVLQGSFIFAKLTQDAAVVRDNLAHLRRYLEMLFGQPSFNQTRNTKRKERP